LPSENLASDAKLEIEVYAMSSQELFHPNHISLLVRWSIVLALWTLLISMASGQSGVSNYRDLQRNNEILELSNANLEYQVANLQLEIETLGSSAIARKRFLKNEIGLVEANEYVYHFHKNQNKIVVKRENLSHFFRP
jgi:cell division protein FtsB